MRRLLITVLCLLAPAAFAQHAGMPMEMGHAPALGASAAFDSHGTLWVVDARDGHIRVRQSTDEGRTLSAPVIVNPVAERIYTEGENRPKIAFGTRGQLYVSWSQPRAKPYTGYVRFARSLDGGAHFEPPLTVQHDRAEITHRFDAMAVDAKGRIVIAWIDKRDLEAASAHDKPYLGAAIYYNWSDDGGATFVPERKLQDHSCECCRIALARTPDGNIAAFYRGVYGDNIRDHAYAVLRTDGQTSTPGRATFSQWQIAGCPHHGPGLAIGNDGVRHGVWYESKDSPTIHYGQLQPGHAPTHLQVVAGQGASHADVAVVGHAVWIVWNQIDATGTALMVRTSSDNGASFAAAHAIAHSEAAVGSPQWIQKDGHVFAAWNTADGFRLIAAQAQP